MKLLTVRQPWAEAIAEASTNPAAKLIENRKFATKYRGPIGIHAGGAWAAWGDDRRLKALWPGEQPAYVMSAVIAIAELVDVHPSLGCCEPWGEVNYAASDGVVCFNVKHWVLEDVRRIGPIPAAGRLGLWTPDPDLLAELEAVRS